MEIIYFEEIESTQKYLLENLKENICIWTTYQTKGIGSRGNSWIGEKGNLFFSFSISKLNLPKDIPLQSLSIYFMYQLKMVLNNHKSNVKFKWPNDLYLKKKIGGIITTLKNDIIVCGIGLNTKVSKEFQSLDITISNETILNEYFELLNLKKSWREIFSLYKEEFYKYRFMLQDAINIELNEDGSIKINNERKYSLR